MSKVISLKNDSISVQRLTILFGTGKFPRGLQGIKRVTGNIRRP